MHEPGLTARYEQVHCLLPAQLARARVPAEGVRDRRKPQAGLERRVTAGAGQTPLQPASARAHCPGLRLPKERLGLDPEARYWAYEFWGGQFLGELPGPRPDGQYTHPGVGVPMTLIASEVVRDVVART